MGLIRLLGAFSYMHGPFGKAAEAYHTVVDRYGPSHADIDTKFRGYFHDMIASLDQRWRQAPLFRP